MKVKALKNYYGGDLTRKNLLVKKGEIYNVIGVDSYDESYWIIDEEGDEWVYDKELFEVIE